MFTSLHAATVAHLPVERHVTVRSSNLERCWHFQLKSESYALSIIVRLVSVYIWLHRSWRPARVLAGWCIEATPCDLSVNILSSLNQCH